MRFDYVDSSNSDASIGFIAVQPLFDLEPGFDLTKALGFGKQRQLYSNPVLSAGLQLRPSEEYPEGASIVCVEQTTAGLPPSEAFHRARVDELAEQIPAFLTSLLPTQDPA